MLLFCRLNCGNKSRGGSYISRERGRVEGNTHGKVGWLGTELGVGEVAKGHLRFILSGQLHRDQPTALCFALAKRRFFELALQGA